MLLTFKGNDDIANTYLLTRFDKCVLIDPSHDLELIKEKIGSLDLIAILITHAHDDHISLIGEFNVPIYINTLDLALLYDYENNGFKTKKMPYSDKKLNIIEFENNYKITFADSHITCFHTPGHTAGSSSFLFKDKLFTGDIIFKEEIGRYDLLGGSIYSLKRSIIDLLENNNNDIKIYPGHGDATTIRHEKKNNPFYLKWSKQLKK